MLARVGRTRAMAGRGRGKLVSPYTPHSPTQPPHPRPQCGPRFELKLYQIKLGTMDQAHAENEWVLRAYTRNAKMLRLAAD